MRLNTFLGNGTVWGDLLSRWVKVPSVPVRSVAVHSPCDSDDSLPSPDVIRAAQRKAVADLGDNRRSFPTIFGQVILADDDLFRVRVGNRDVLWIPSGDKALQDRLMLCAHMRSAGHRGVSPTLFRLKEYCVRSHMVGLTWSHMFASSFVNVCIVWIRVLERSCLARMATRYMVCLLYTSPSPRDKRQSRMPSSA